MKPPKLGELQKKAINKSNKAISAIENAIAVWEGSERKPTDLRIRVERLRDFHEALCNWEKKMLTDIAQEADYKQRLSRIKEFSDICRSYRSR